VQLLELEAFESMSISSPGVRHTKTIPAASTTGSWMRLRSDLSKSPNVDSP
jgi:hypothetical protein